MERADRSRSCIMQENLFYGGDIPRKENVKVADEAKTYYWVSTRLIRESGPWDSECLRSPDNVRDLVRDHFDIENCDREYFIALYLDRKGKVNAANLVSMGGLHSSIVHPREVFKPALLTSSASIILAHNHPSGDPTPSQDDISITRRLAEAGSILGIEILDHVVVGYNNYTSFKEKGLI